MRVLTVSTFLFTVVLQCSSETWSINATDSSFPGMCVYEENAYPPGEFQIKNRCIRLICSNNGWISGHSCVEGSLEGCHRGLPINVKRPFPDCCKRKYTCQHGDGTEYEIEDY